MVPQGLAVRVGVLVQDLAGVGAVELPDIAAIKQDGLGHRNLIADRRAALGRRGAICRELIGIQYRMRPLAGRAHAKDGA